MAGPAFRVAGARAQSAGATSIAPAKPAVDGQNGILLCVVTSKNNAAHSTGTSGWSQIGAQINSGANFTASLWIAAESAGAPTFTWTGSVACSGQICYYSDPANVVSTSIGASASNSGATATHSSAAFTSTQNNSLAVYVDVAAAATALTNPSGWSADSDTGSATDAGETSFGSKAIAASGSSSGAISVTGANAAWVEWQIELLGQTPTAGFQISRGDLGSWLTPPLAGFAATKAELGGWLIPPLAGFSGSKEELGAWLIAPNNFWVSKEEMAAWFFPPAGFSGSKFEVGAWLVKALRANGSISILW